MSEQRQQWLCEGCGLYGVVTYRPSDDVLKVVHKIEDHHERLASKYAPTCHFDYHRVRVHNPEEMDMYAWNRKVIATERKTESRRVTSRLPFFLLQPGTDYPMTPGEPKARCQYKCWKCRNRCKGKLGHSSPFDYRGHFCKKHKRARGKTDV